MVYRSKGRWKPSELGYNDESADEDDNDDGNDGGGRN